MAYAFTAASSRYLSTASTPVTAMPLTIAGWFNFPFTGVNQGIAGVNAVGTGVTGSFRLALNSSNQVVANCAAGATQGVSAFTGVSANTWTHACGVFASATSRTAYANGIAADANATSASPAGVNAVHIGVNWPSAGATGYANGQIAEVGIWNVALSAQEIASLAKGVTCDKVRPQSLVFYAPLIRDLTDCRNSLAISNINAATVANHPRVYA